MVWLVDSAQVMLIKPAGEDDALMRFIATVPFAAPVLNHILTSPHDAISVVDCGGIMRYISPTHERWLGLRSGEAVGRPAHQIIPNSRMAEVAASGVAEIGQPYSADGVATRIVELDRGILRSYPGNFSAYERMKEEQLAADALHFDAQVTARAHCHQQATDLRLRGLAVEQNLEGLLGLRVRERPLGGRENQPFHHLDAGFTIRNRPLGRLRIQIAHAGTFRLTPASFRNVPII